jgi:hypothetical protein
VAFLRECLSGGPAAAAARRAAEAEAAAAAAAAEAAAAVFATTTTTTTVGRHGGAALGSAILEGDQESDDASEAMARGGDDDDVASVASVQSAIVPMAGDSDRRLQGAGHGMRLARFVSCSCSLSYTTARPFLFVVSGPLWFLLGRIRGRPPRCLWGKGFRWVGRGLVHVMFQHVCPGATPFVLFLDDDL